MQRWRGGGGWARSFGKYSCFLDLCAFVIVLCLFSHNSWRLQSVACPSRRFFAAHFELFPVFHPSTLTTFLNTSEDTFDCGNFFSNKTFEVFQRNCVKFMEMQVCAFHIALQDWGQLHFRTEQIPEIPKMAKLKELQRSNNNIHKLTIVDNYCQLLHFRSQFHKSQWRRNSKEFKEQTTTFTSWDLYSALRCYENSQVKRLLRNSLLMLFRM